MIYEEERLKGGIYDGEKEKRKKHKEIRRIYFLEVGFHDE